MKTRKYDDTVAFFLLLLLLLLHAWLPLFFFQDETLQETVGKNIFSPKNKKKIYFRFAFRTKNLQNVSYTSHYCYFKKVFPRVLFKIEC